MESKFVSRAKELRAIENPRYNCAQAVLIPFAEEKGVDVQNLFDITRNFNQGMKQGKTCGAVTGGLMALSLYGIYDVPSIQEYYATFKANHQGETDCQKLLEQDMDKFESRQERCGALVYECVSIVEKMIKERK